MFVTDLYLDSSISKKSHGFDREKEMFIRITDIEGKHFVYVSRYYVRYVNNLRVSAILLYATKLLLFISWCRRILELKSFNYVKL